jgi:hypothetical protein
MPATEKSQIDSAPGVVPTPRAAAPWRVMSVEILSDRSLKVVFTDGTSGEVQMKDFLDGAAVVGTVFEALRDPTIFRQARVELGAVVWPNGADLAPDAMYDSIRDSGYWTVVGD